MADRKKERTFVMLKPDAVQRGLVGKVLSRFEEKGLKFCGLKLVTPPRAHFETHYQEHKGKGFFNGLVNFMLSGPVVAVCVEGDQSIKRVRNMMGATRPLDSAPGTLRGDFCIDVGLNLVHGSDSLESANKELKHWFQPSEIVDYSATMDKWIYE